MCTATGLEAANLRLLGLRIQLGHKPSDFCPNPIGDNHFLILDAHGLHEVNLDYCGCPATPTRRDQLLAARLYPCGDGPRTAVAFEMANLHEAWSPPASMRVRNPKGGPPHKKPPK
jgi:hypothetical protein